MPFVNETVEKWNSRNQNVQNMLAKPSNKSKAFNKTIIEQVR